MRVQEETGSAWGKHMQRLWRRKVVNVLEKNETFYQTACLFNTIGAHRGLEVYVHENQQEMGGDKIYNYGN